VGGWLVTQPAETTKQEKKMHRKQKALLYGAVSSLTIALASVAQATPMVLTLTALDLTTSVSNTAVFTDAGTPNSIVVPGGVQGDIVFSGENSFSIVLANSGQLTTGAQSVTNTSLTDTYRLSATLTGMNFNPPANQVFLSGSGTFANLSNTSSTYAGATYNWYDDPTNSGVAGAGQLVGTYTSGSFTGVTTSFAYQLNGGAGAALLVPDNTTYGMSEVWTFDLGPQQQLTSRGLTETKVYTPEPASLFLLGAGMFGLGIIRNHRRG
jgi:hypothetical protein